MDRPYIFCHMLTSIDGKIMGTYMDMPESEPTSKVFYELAFGSKPYCRYKEVGSDGKTVRVYKETYAPNGKLIHTDKHRGCTKGI